MLLIACVFGYLLIGLFVSGIVNRLVHDDGDWWGTPAPFFSLIFMPATVVCLIVYAIIQALTVIAERINIETPASWGYKFANWLTTPKSETKVRINGCATSVGEEVPAKKPEELIAAEQEVEALLNGGSKEQTHG